MAGGVSLGEDLVVTALQDEALDALLWRVLGSTDALELVLEANPSLAGLDALLPEGGVVRIPASIIAAATASSAPGGGSSRSAPIVNLWD